ncbi:MAG: hypothetical protein O3C40_24920 [Planctomycetota bacterium]|nr:hypothetical protein [Planctomycetota bacterium]
MFGDKTGFLAPPPLQTGHAAHSAEGLAFDLKHCGLWQASAPRAPPDVDGLVHELNSAYSDNQTGSSDQLGELTYVDIDTFLAP